MRVEELIRKTRDQEELTTAEIEFLIRGMAEGTVEDYQLAAWAMAVYFRGLSPRETADLTKAMANSGDTVDLSGVAGMVVDKHSTGGVGDKTTLVVLPLVACLGLPVAKMSGRGLGHTGGTIDKLESIPGFKTELDKEAFTSQVNRLKAAVAAQTGNLVPADKKLYALRDVTATVEALPLIASSIMSKKLAAGAGGIVLDVKTGTGAFMSDLSDALELAQWMVAIGKEAGREMAALVTDMNQPLGNMVGNALEVQEAIATLKGQGPQDLTEISLELAAEMLALGKVYPERERARQAAEAALKDGRAYRRFLEIVKAQQGVIMEEAPGYGLPQAKLVQEITAKAKGYVYSLNALWIGQAAGLLGAGRARMGEAVDPAAGIELMVKRGDPVRKGEVLAKLYYNQAADLAKAVRLAEAAYQIKEQAPPKLSLIYQRLR